MRIDMEFGEIARIIFSNKSRGISVHCGANEGKLESSSLVSCILFHYRHDSPSGYLSLLFCFIIVYYCFFAHLLAFQATL
jgi:hypothetical protein